MTPEEILRTIATELTDNILKLNRETMEKCAAEMAIKMSNHFNESHNDMTNAINIMNKHLLNLTEYVLLTAEKPLIEVHGDRLIILHDLLKNSIKRD